MAHDAQRHTDGRGRVVDDAKALVRYGIARGTRPFLSRFLHLLFVTNGPAVRFKKKRSIATLRTPQSKKEGQLCRQTVRLVDRVHARPALNLAW